ncbi:MAG: 16S rRNA (cytidine(1402)-2'-O)-methyltransferase [Acidimicrobiia bacterium]|nr:16S rRNA (cytidine(1402)-2'-O)-methyltransferase [Acidimicrobiia bacterium]
MSEERRAALYVVATPIGNLDDLSIRAARTLETADVIACEDTRRTRKLLTHIGVTGKRLIPCHDHNERNSAAGIVKLLDQGRSVALCSDAGTPLLSDPGYRVVTAVREAGFDVVAVPGPSAVSTALVVSGLPPDRFVFLGFAPRKPGRRRRWLADIRRFGCTAVLLESAQRLPALLADALDELGDIDGAVCVELTKRFEEVVTGPLSELAARFEEPPRGEVTVVLDGGAVDGAAFDTRTEEAGGDHRRSGGVGHDHGEASDAGPAGVPPDWPPLGGRG